MKVLAFGDLHLGQGADLGRFPGDRLRDQADVLDRIADVAIQRDVSLVLVAGDVFEGPSIPPEQLDIFASFVDRCRHARIPVLAITGNGKHDAAVRATNGLAIFSHIPGVTVSSFPDVYRLGGCAVATLPWVSPARLVASRGGGDRDELHGIVAQLLTDIAQRGKEDCERLAPGVPHILLGHWSLSGASLPTGLPVDALREPVIPVGEIDAVGFDHVVWGHIHKAQQVGERGFYVGSPLPLNFGEQTDRLAHGVTIIHTDETEAIDFYAAEFVPVESRPLVTLDIDITGDTETTGLAYIDTGYAAKDADLQDVIVRLRYRATAEQQRRIDLPLIRRELLEAGAYSVQLKPEIVRADRARVEGLDDQVGDLDALDAWLDATSYDGDRDRLRSRAALYLEAGAA